MLTLISSKAKLGIIKVLTGGFMNKSVLISIIALLLLVGGIGFAVTRPKSQPANTAPVATTTTTTPHEDATAHTHTASDAQNHSASDETTEVVIKNSAYSPATIKIKAGTKVTWTNQDEVKHDVAPDEDYGNDFKPSELLSEGASYSFTFNKAGTYTYHCTPHPFMKGSVEVTN